MDKNIKPSDDVVGAYDLYLEYVMLIRLMSSSPGMYQLDNKRANLHKQIMEHLPNANHESINKHFHDMNHCLTCYEFIEIIYKK